MKLSKLSRVVHRWGSIVVLVPMTIIIVSGITLQLKKESAYIQPPTQRGIAAEPTIGFDRILEVAKSVPEAEIASWEEQLDKKAAVKGAEKAGVLLLTLGEDVAAEILQHKHRDACDRFPAAFAENQDAAAQQECDQGCAALRQHNVAGQNGKEHGVRESKPEPPANGVNSSRMPSHSLV